MQSCQRLATATDIVDKTKKTFIGLKVFPQEKVILTARKISIRKPPLAADFLLISIVLNHGAITVEYGYGYRL